MQMLTKIFIVFSLLCSVAYGANDFSGDANCVALWKLDNGVLTVDSIGSNTLTNSSMDSDAVTYKEGDGSAYANALGDSLYIINASSDLPFDSDKSTPSLSVCCWVRCIGFPSSGQRTILAKWDTGERTFQLDFYKSGTWQISWWLGYNAGDDYEGPTLHGTTVAANTWYHIGFTYNDSTKGWKLRIWDDTAGALLGGAEATGTTTNNMYCGSANFQIGTNQIGSVCASGQRDEVVIFDDILTSAEIDQIRAGTYGGGAPPATAGQVIMIEEL